MDKLIPFADNVLLALEPKPAQTASGIQLVHGNQRGARESRTAIVLASGRGYYTRLGAFVENQTKPGQRVVVDALAGQNYDFDVSQPRHFEIAQEFRELMGERGDFRVVREAEIMAILEE